MIDFPLEIFLIDTLSGLSTLGCETQFPPSVCSPFQMTDAYISKISGFSSKVIFVRVLSDFVFFVRGLHPATIQTKPNTIKNFQISLVLSNKIHSNHKWLLQHLN